MMKKLAFLLVLFVAVSASNIVYGQGRYGADSAECVKYLSFYQTYMKQMNLDEAAPLWRKAISICPPTASQNMLLDGMKILRKEINTNRKNPIRKASLIDTLMILHQMRIDNYPANLIKAKTNQASDMINYMKEGEEMKLYTVLGEVIDIAKNQTSLVHVVRYMGFANDLYQVGKLSSEDVMNSFNKSISTLEFINKSKPSEDVTNAMRDVENLLMQSGVASCENLVALFTPRYEKDPTNKEELGKMVNMLTTSNCLSEELFLNAVESLHKLEASANSSYLLYKLYSQRENISKASEYLQEAIDTEVDMNTKAGYSLEKGTFLFKKAGNSADAVKAAKFAAECNPEISGKAYFLVGTIWGSLKCSGNDIEVRAPYWIAVDYLIKAKNADSSLAEEANNLINSYSKYFPLQSEAFMFDVIDGSSYTVECGGMREVTKVRTQK